MRSTGPVETTEGADAETALAAYADGFARRAGAATLAAPPTVWCSWYRYFEQVTADDVLENLRAFDEHDLHVDVVQVDDGWSPGLGEGLVVADRFGSLEAVVDEVRSTGRRAGIWVAPFVVGARSTLATEHPDWLVGPAGRNWGDDLVGLDLTHPRRPRPARRDVHAAGRPRRRLPQARLPLRGGVPVLGAVAAPRT